MSEITLSSTTIRKKATLICFVENFNLLNRMKIHGNNLQYFMIRIKLQKQWIPNILSNYKKEFRSKQFQCKTLYSQMSMHHYFDILS